MLTRSQFLRMPAQHDNVFLFKAERKTRELPKLAKRVEMDDKPVERWSVKLERGTSLNGFGLNNNPVSRKNRAARKHKAIEF